MTNTPTEETREFAYQMIHTTGLYSFISNDEWDALADKVAQAMTDAAATLINAEFDKVEKVA